MNLKITIKTLLAFLVVVLTACSTVAEKPNDFRSFDDVLQARVGVLLGSTQDAFATAEMLDAEIIRIESEPDMFLALQQGKCDVIMLDHTIFDYAKLQYPGMEVIPSNLATDNYGMGFNKENVALHKRFNDFLQQIRDNGLYQEIYDRWIVNGVNGVMPEIQTYTDGEPLRVAVTGAQYPFAFIQEQELVGFDIEIILRFASEVQRPVEFQNISFGSLIASLQAGKSDIISAAMSITEERQKMVLFSDPYYETHTVVIKARSNADGQVAAAGLWQKLKDSFTSNILAEKRYMLIVNGLKTTIVLSVLSVLLGTILGGIICYMRMSRSRWLRNISAGYIALMRGLPVLVLLMLMFYVFLAKLPIDGVQVAIITFALNFSAYVSEMFRTAIQGVDRGQTEAGIALGFTSVQTFYHIVMPQAVKSVLPVYKGEMISLIKMTSIVGYIAVEDLTKMSDIIRSRTFDAFFPLIMVAILYFILAWVFSKALDMLNPKHQQE